ncbi:U7 snRNA-associated Sm-like protein LSm10 [Phytophthora cinnamomi]|uniref:U7 snRNA-associated Sm-like protein LSm10 n=1 Tax=Phytophthora cinnamomi TaxID=4785 RepID=UPI00355A87AD|nr:U7 snRNA-associated Sm-like protein LSm10 [Phytophthora cinnamomi]
MQTAEQPPPRRKRRKPRSLLLLLKSFVGLRVRIDLKNDSVLEGVVQEVVQDMDFTLLDACETKPNGTKLMLDEVFVMGKTVLYVHIPDRINISQHLQQYTRMLRQSATMYTRAKRTAPSSR